MKNFEKYQTAEERSRAHIAFCRENNCTKCPARADNADCRFAWLELEAEEEQPLPCPFCGGEVGVDAVAGHVFCKECTYIAGHGSPNIESAIAAHNGVAQVVLAAKKEGEVRQP